MLTSLGLFFFERKYGPSITANEVAQLLQGFGKLDFIRPANPFELAQLNLNEGILVQFQIYDDGQAAAQASIPLPLSRPALIFLGLS